MEFIASLWGESKHDFSSPSVPGFSLQWVLKKKNPFCTVVVSKIQKHMRALDDTYSTNINQEKSDILWWHVLVIQCCSMKYWKQRYVGVDFDHSLLFCSSSAALRPCQARSKHTATCVSGQRLPQTSHSPCSAYLQQWWLLKIQGAAWTSLIYLLACLMLRVTLKRNHRCTHVDTGTRALICDTRQWTNRHGGFHAGKLSHAL